MSRISKFGALAAIAVIATVLSLGGSTTGAGADIVAWTNITEWGDNVGDANADHATPGFKVDDEGVVHLRGLAFGAGAPTTFFGAYAVHLFDLPCEARPEYQLSMPATVAGASADPQPVLLRVFPTGSVDLFVGPTGAAITEVESEMVFTDYVTLDGFEWEWDSTLICSP